MINLPGEDHPPLGGRAQRINRLGRRFTLQVHDPRPPVERPKLAPAPAAAFGDGNINILPREQWMLTLYDDGTLLLCKSEQGGYRLWERFAPQPFDGGERAGSRPTAIHADDFDTVLGDEPPEVARSCS